ncbi:hypothetical protein NDU88_003361 [Pleurodeles waltl]|uniref:Uncharacterized protein n=1 Tax=Pleurodeles waltl TaxID=8319 RepID=A0AAV7W5D3_PLEWA|nr:hypothetical protein NDU88_003361 [Pleurodeles waltl]
MRARKEPHTPENISLADLPVTIITLRDDLAHKIDSVAINFNLLRTDLRMVRELMLRVQDDEKVLFFFTAAEANDWRDSKAGALFKTEPRRCPLSGANQASPLAWSMESQETEQNTEQNMPGWHPESD